MEDHTYEDKSTVAERLTGVRDPKDPDGLLTIEQDADRPDPARYGRQETDTLAREQAHYDEVRARAEAGEQRATPRPPEKHGVTALD